MKDGKEIYRQIEKEIDREIEKEIYREIEKEIDREMENTTTERESYRWNLIVGRSRPQSLGSR